MKIVGNQENNGILLRGDVPALRTLDIAGGQHPVQSVAEDMGPNLLDPIQLFLQECLPSFPETQNFKFPVPLILTINLSLV